MDDLTKVNRFEVIDHRAANGGPRRILTVYSTSAKLELSLQDDGKTLKVFLSDPQTQ